MRVVPLVGTEAGENVHHQADDDVRRDYVQPDLDCERIEKGKEAGALTTRSLEKYADAEIHERLREINVLFS